MDLRILDAVVIAHRQLLNQLLQLLMHHTKGLALIDEGLIQRFAALELLNALGVIFDQPILLSDGLLKIIDLGF